METFKLTIKKLMTLFLMGSVILLFNSCSEDAIDIDETGNSKQLVSWNELLDQLDLESDISFVQNGESIQDALDAAEPGDVIYISPGTYDKNFSNNKTDVKLIGFSLSPEDITIKSSKENNIDILKLYNKKSVDNFKRNSQNRGKRSRITDFSRTELGAGIVHYKFTVKMGNGEFDKIQIHRVVRESRPYYSIPTKGDVFMVHGAFVGFEGTFLANGLESSDDINSKTSLPFYLASKNIDVWGIDMGWTMVPSTTDSDFDFGFMEGWGYEKDAKHTLKAMRIARAIRGISGQGFSGLNLLGFSSGNTVAYAAANRETQKHSKWKRHIKGIISLDNAFKTLDMDSGCVAAEEVAAEIAGGQFQNANGEFFSLLANLASPISPSNPIGDPDGTPSLFGPSFTNIQAFRLFFYTTNIVPFQFFVGDLGGPFYSDEARALKAVSSYSSFMPNLLWQEIDAVNCSSMDVSFDDYFDQISVPILYIGAELGSGASAGFYTGEETASTDVTNLLVNSIGHVDTVLGNDADQDVWSLLRNWIGNHR